MSDDDDIGYRLASLTHSRNTAYCCMCDVDHSFSHSTLHNLASRHSLRRPCDLSCTTVVSTLYSAGFTLGRAGGKNGSPYSITERRGPELILVLGT